MEYLYNSCIVIAKIIQYINLAKIECGKHKLVAN